MGDRHRGVAALPGAHRLLRRCRRPGSNDCARSCRCCRVLHSCTPTSCRPRGLYAGPARTLARSGAGDRGAPGASGSPLGAPRRKWDCGSRERGTHDPPGVQPSPQPWEGGCLPRGADRSVAGASPSPRARGISSLSPGNPSLTQDAAPFLLTTVPTQGGSRMRGSGGLTTTAHFQVPQLWEGATNGATGAGGGGWAATFHSLLCFPLAGARQLTHARSGQRSQGPSRSVLWAYVSARRGTKDDRS